MTLTMKQVAEIKLFAINPSMQSLIATIQAKHALIEEMRAALKTLIDSAVPHPVEHPTMTAAWAIGRAMLIKAEAEK